MKEKEILRILKSHSIPFYTKNNQIYVDSMESDTELFEKVENVTSWSRRKLFDWLGY